jgi:SHS2 domain-containing protein
MLPRSAVLEHTSEVELRVRAPTWPDLLAEAGRALSARLWDGATPPLRGEGVWRRIELHAADRAALLVDWLNELLYHAEAEWWVPVEFVINAASDQELHAHVRGVPVEHAPAAVKAATLYDADVAVSPAGLEATVVLDV